ncbi:hypothetical protein GRF29_28g1908730 [Pseudopithomyces chartarum]|uniref:Uncharacterized protein n=1 Tax=Pseudopithomyces chartarum TaxID=1892770 RepID=A0AAN6M4Q0_9PLEO|nr:hypothetical protein GRF29_28g1908730 [Pseudopithomyces chartarum]
MKLFAVFQLLALAGLPVGRAGSSHPAVVARDFDPNRLASDGTWSKFKCKGEQLMQAMKGSDQEAAKIMNLPAAQSVWSGDLKGELLQWGYVEGHASYINCDLKGYWAVESACIALGLDTRPKLMGGPNICYNFLHWDPNKKDGKGTPIPNTKQTYNVGGKEYRVTGAEMQIGINPVGGVVFMQYVTSPATSAANVWNKKPTQDELPALRRLSDIMWGAWNRENSAIDKIKYFWVQGVGNTNTKSIIARALKEKGKGLEKWPGTTLDMSEDGALAILGSENGACWGFFLAQHKKELGNMFIEKVQIFKNNRNANPDPDLLFHIKQAVA